MKKTNWWLIPIGIALALALVACGKPNPQPAGLTPIPSLAPAQTLTLVPALQGGAGAAAGGPSGQGVAAEGAAVFVLNCTRCHGIEGQGVDAPALRNSQFIQTQSQEAIYNVVASGVTNTEMPAWLQDNGGPLTPADVLNAVAYLKTLQGVAPLPSATPAAPEPTETPPPAGAPTPEPAKPSNPGGTGQALSLTGDPARGRPEFGLFCSACHGPEGVQGRPNPDSDDGVVPELNPIDPTIANPDPKAFAANLDLFIEHGSVPEGEGPLLLMPAFGDSQMLTPQQIADLIAYVISLNR